MDIPIPGDSMEMDVRLWKKLAAAIQGKPFSGQFITEYVII